MKNVILIMVLFFTMTAVAQKSNNAIQITTELDYQQTFRMVGQVLTQRGFRITHSDINLGVINTADKEVIRGVKERYRITVEENVVTLWLESWTNLEPQWSRVISTNRGWSSIERFAVHIGGEIEHVRL